MKKIIIGENAPKPWAETEKTAKQQREFVESLPGDFTFSTNSLFVMRELQIKFNEELIVENTDTGLMGDLDSVGEIQALEEELKQSDRYLEWSNHVSS